MSYLAKVEYLSLNTKRLDMLGYRSKFKDEVYLTPSGAIIVDPDVGACFVPNQCIEMAVLAEGWREEIDPPLKPKEQGLPHPFGYTNAAEIKPAKRAPRKRGRPKKDE